MNPQLKHDCRMSSAPLLGAIRETLRNQNAFARPNKAKQSKAEQSKKKKKKKKKASSKRKQSNH